MNVLDLVRKVAEIRMDRCIGRLCLRGHRIELRMIVELLESGWSTEEILREFPSLERDLVERVRENLHVFRRLVRGMGLVEIDPNKMAGLPVVRGTRIPVIRVYEMLENSMSVQELIREFPSLRLCDVEELLRYRDVLYPVMKHVHERLVKAFHEIPVKLL